MTLKEAIDILRNAAWLGSNEDRDRTEEAVNMAIEALETQNKNHCADCQEFDCYGCEYRENKS